MIKTALLIISDRSACGLAEDRTGPLLREMLEKAGLQLLKLVIIPDDIIAIQNELFELSDQIGADVVFTSGGTGLGPRDVTPEATEMVIDRRIPGIAEAMRAGSLTRTPFAMLSRATAGMRGSCLIINLPGSPTGSADCLQIVLPILDHALHMIRGGGHEPEVSGDGGQKTKAE